MTFFRQADARFPFFWESDDQMAARWHGDGEGPAQYLADTPDGAWAEFLRHEEITDPADLAGITRAMWAVDVDDPPMTVPVLQLPVLLGGEDSYGECQDEARRLRSDGAQGLTAPSAALLPGTAAGWHTRDGLRRAEPRDGKVIVLFGPHPKLIAWSVARDARPPLEVLDHVRHFMDADA